MLRVDGAQKFLKGIDKWLEDVETLAAEAHRGLSIKLFEAVLRNSPQYSGNAVANWKYSVNSKDVSFDDFFKELLQNKQDELGFDNVEPYSKTQPNDQAEAYAIANASGRELAVTKLSDVIYISNSVNYDEWLATATEANLREANHVGHLISQAESDVIEGHLFISTSKAQELGRERIA